MARGYPLLVNDVPIQSSEILYQACRYPDFPDVQKAILTQGNPYEAKQISRKFDAKTRRGWDKNRISIMKWCVCVKLCQNWENFYKLLNCTGDSFIVEHSDKDLFWGARKEPDGNFYGINVLGRILMETRESAKLRGPSGFALIPPLPLENFKLLGEDIREVTVTKPTTDIGHTLTLF